MTRIERIIFLSLIGFLLLGIATRFCKQKSARVNWRVEHSAKMQEVEISSSSPSSSLSLAAMQPVYTEKARASKKSKKKGAKKKSAFVKSAKSAKPRKSIAKLTAADAPLDINRASQQDLQRLPGVGKVTAARILEYRDQHGAFEQKSDLLKVPGLRPSTYQKLEPYIEVPSAQ